MAQKLYDLAVKTGEYVKNGETKSRYENIGAVMQNDNGKFIMLKRTFNPAGVNSDRDNILVSMFEPRQNNQQQSQGQQDGYQSPGGYGAGGSAMDDGDQIPFAPVTLI